MNKKRGLLISAIIFSIFAFSIVSSASCSLSTSCATENTVLNLYSTTNSHAELYNQNNYAQKLCCDFSGTHTCDGTNAVLKLSSSTNAHAEVKSGTSYTNSVCFADLQCISGSACTTEYNIPMLSISGNTNAHLAEFNYYSTKICCKRGAEPILQWVNPEMDSMVYSPTSIDDPHGFSLGDNFKLKIQNPHVSSGDIVVQEYNENTNSYEAIATVSSSMSDSYLISTFQASQSSLDLATPQSNVYQFRYEISGKTSEILYAERTLSHCENGFQDADEEGRDCGGVDCGTCCGDGICNATIGESTETCAIDCPATREARWGVNSPLSLQTDSLVDGVPIDLILYFADNPAEARFTLKEDDPWSVTNPFGTDDLIFSDQLGFQDGADAKYTWNADLESFKKAEKEDKSDNRYEFYFEVDGLESSILEIQLDSPLPTCSDGSKNGDEEGIDCGGSCPDSCLCVNKAICGDYTSKDNCNADPCSLANDSAITAGDVSCSWDSVSEICKQRLSVSVNGINIGSCLYDEDTSQDTCEDGFLSYSWDADWRWSSTNTFTQSPEGEGYIEEPLGSGSWHYDPELAHQECQPGEATIPCPAQIQLSFFTWINLVAVVLIVIIAYIIINKRKKAKLKSSDSKKPIKKKAVVKKGVTKKASKNPTSKKRK